MLLQQRVTVGLISTKHDMRMQGGLPVVLPVLPVLVLLLPILCCCVSP